MTQQIDLASAGAAFEGFARPVEDWAEKCGGVRFERHTNGSVKTGMALPTEKRMPSQAALHNAARARNRWPIGYVLTETQYRDALHEAGGIRLT